MTPDKASPSPKPKEVKQNTGGEHWQSFMIEIDKKFINVSKSLQ